MTHRAMTVERASWQRRTLAGRVTTVYGFVASGPLRRSVASALDMHMPSRSRAAALALLLASAPAFAPLQAQRPSARPAAPIRHGFSVERLTRIDSAFQRMVDRGQIAGAVVLVLRDGEAAGAESVYCLKGNV